MDDLTMEALHDDGEEGERLKNHLYRNERYVKALQNLLPFFAKKGAFAPGAEKCNAIRQKSS